MLQTWRPEKSVSGKLFQNWWERHVFLEEMNQQKAVRVSTDDALLHTPKYVSFPSKRKGLAMYRFHCSATKIFTYHRLEELLSKEGHVSPNETKLSKILLH